jgi:hypothetical protein
MSNHAPFTSKEQIRRRYALIGKHQKTIPHSSKLMKVDYTLKIANDRKLLEWVMSLADAKGNPIECNIQVGGLTYIFWDGILLCWGISYSDGRGDVANHSKDIEIILNEVDARNRYENLGYDSESPYDGDYREADYEYDDDRAMYRF